MRKAASISASLTGRRRSGFSLIEIIIATAILMGSVGVLARLAGMGRTMAQKADLLSEAQRICERTLNEIVLGDRPLQFVDRAVLEPVVSVDSPGQELAAPSPQIRVRRSAERWVHTVRVTPLQGMPELVRVTVTVAPDTDADTAIQPADPSSSPRPARRDQFTLSRWMRSPANGSALEDGVFDLAGGL